jgi:plastocyanin
MKISPLIARTLAMAVLALGACSDSPTANEGDPPGGGPSNDPPSGTVLVEPTSFRPSVITVPVGGTVTWDNYLGDPHTITPNDHNAFPRVEFSTKGKVLEVTFTEPGNYRYVCELHGGMVGMVVVQ